MSTTKKLVPLLLTLSLVLGVYNCTMAHVHDAEDEQSHQGDPGHAEMRR